MRGAHSPRALNILLTNDDGITSECLRLLQHRLTQVGHRAIILAPATEQSTTGHSLTLKRGLQLRQQAQDVYTLDGFPADCVYVGLHHLMQDCPCDLVISGVNKGGNLGQDLFYSGTAAAAREASFHGVPALATSLTVERAENRGMPLDFSASVDFVVQMVQWGVHQWISPYNFLNVNIPAVSKIRGARLTTQGLRRYRLGVQELSGSSYQLVTGEQREFLAPDRAMDIAAIEEDHISVTPIHYLYPNVHSWQPLQKCLQQYTLSQQRELER